MGKMAGDEALRRQMEGVFVSTEARVIAAFKVVKCAPSTTSAWKKKLPKSQGKERVLCLTAVRRTKKRGFKGTVHACKLAQGRYQIRSSFPLKGLTSLEAKSGVVGGEDKFFLELSFQVNAFSDQKWAYELASEDLQASIVGILYSFCKKHEDKSPAIYGVEPSDLEHWLQQHPDIDGQAIGSFGQAVAREEEGGAEAGAHEDEGPSFVSSKEEKDLQNLLEMFSMGVADVEEFQERLTHELSGLEAANVHAILESGPQVGKVLGRLKEAEVLLDDLEENLSVFDIKLRHMREDIAAIEARNNRLELHTRNNSKLLTTLEGLLDKLVLEEETEAMLIHREFDYASIPSIVAAARELQAHLLALQDGRAGGEQGGGLRSMNAVVEQRARLQALARNFVERAVRFMAADLSHIADDAINRTSAAMSGSSKLQAPDHGDIRLKAERIAPLLKVVRALKASSVAALRERYCSSMNALLRRELRAASSQLRKAVGQATASAPSEPDFTRNSSSRASEGSADSGSPVHRSGGSVSGRTRHNGPGLLPNAAYQQYLSVFLPFLLEEADLACHFLLVYRSAPQPEATPDAASTLQSRASSDSLTAAAQGLQGRVSTADGAADEGEEGGAQRRSSAMGGGQGSRPALGSEGQRVVSALLEGIQPDFLTLVDTTAKSHQLLCVAMLGATLGWRARLRGHPCAAPLLKALEECLARLVVHFEKYLWEKVTAINRYEGKGAIAVGKTGAQGVLPFMASFAGMAHQLEELLAAEEAADAFSTPDSGTARRLDMGGSPEASESGESGAAEALLSEAEIPAAIPPANKITHVRDVVSPAYSVLARSMFSAIERLATADPKHGDRLRLENYAHFEESVRELARRVRTLAIFHAQANAAKESAMVLYIQQQLDYAKMWKIFEFSQRVEALLQEVGTEEVAFQLHYQATDLRAHLNACMTQPKQKFALILSRIKKHFALTSPQLALEVWSRLEQAVLTRYGILAEQIAVCYNSIQLKPTVEELAQILETTT